MPEENPYPQIAEMLLYVENPHQTDPLAPI
jgi:hypothetical protein